MANNKKQADATVQNVDEALSKSEQFVENNKNIITWCLVGIIVIVAAVWGWNAYSNSQNQKAKEEIWSAQYLFEAGDYEQALEAFEAVIDQYGSTKTGNLAKAYAGLCNKELGNYEEAISLLKKYSGSDAVVAPAVMAAIGDCQVNSETPDYREAAHNFEAAAKASNSAEYTPLYLKKAGLAYEKAGDNASALNAYQAIKDNWRETTIGQSIDKYIVRVQ